MSYETFLKQRPPMLLCSIEVYLKKLLSRINHVPKRNCQKITSYTDSKVDFLNFNTSSRFSLFLYLICFNLFSYKEKFAGRYSSHKNLGFTPGPRTWVAEHSVRFNLTSEFFSGLLTR